MRFTRNSTQQRWKWIAPRKKKPTVRHETIEVEAIDAEPNEIDPPDSFPCWVLCRNDEQKWLLPATFASDDPSSFSVQLHHGGTLDEIKGIYVGGDVDILHDINVMYNWHDIYSFGNLLGHRQFVLYYVSVGRKCFKGLTAESFGDMVNNVVDRKIVVYMKPFVEKNPAQIEAENELFRRVYPKSVLAKLGVCDVEEEGKEPEPHDEEEQVDEEEQADHLEQAHDVDAHEEKAQPPDDVGGNETDSGVSVDNSFCDSEFEHSDDDGLVDSNAGELPPFLFTPAFNASVAAAMEVSDNEDYAIVNADVVHYDCDIGGSESEDEYFPNYTVFNPQTDMKNPAFEIGMAFHSVKEFRAAVREYGILNGKDLNFKINLKKKVLVTCKKGCSWRIYGSNMQRENTFQIKTYYDKHAESCGREFKNKHFTYSWIAHKYLDKIAVFPEWPVESFRTDILKTYQLDASNAKLYRAKNKAISIIEGTIREQYANLWHYLEEIRRSDPDTTVKLDLIPGKQRKIGEDPQPTFHRLYMCLGACKKGFKAGCRPVLGFDGTHLKGLTKGMMLTAVGIDANDQIFVVAYVVVEAESYDSWLWFLELVISDVEITNGHGWTFISDKQKGLIDVIAELVPNAEHRHCMKHFANNFRTHVSGLEGRGLLWAAAKACYTSAFDNIMDRMKENVNEGYEWLANHPPQHWSRAHFRTWPKCHILTNNMCEAFNKVIRKARGKAIITMLEQVRCYLMSSMQRGRLQIQKYQHNICPHIQAKLEEKKKLFGGCGVMWSGGGKFQVTDGPEKQFGVNIDDRTCACRYWDLTGIPCEHAIACIYARSLRPEDFVDNYYLKETQMSIYEHIIPPINGPEMWPRSKNIPPGLPPFRRPPGRPKKNERKKSAFEKEDQRMKKGKLKRKNTTVRCGICGGWSHNKRTCKGIPNEERMREEANKRKYMFKDKGESSQSVPPQAKEMKTNEKNPVLRKKTVGRKKMGKKATVIPPPQVHPLQSFSINLPPMPPKVKANAKPSWDHTTKVLKPTSWPLNENAYTLSAGQLRRSQRKIQAASTSAGVKVQKMGHKKKTISNTQ